MTALGQTSGRLMGLVLTPAPTTATVEVGGEAVLVDDRSGHAYALNASGALLWALLDGESTLHEICVDIAAGLEVPFSRVAEDVEAIAARLLDMGLAVAPGFAVPVAPDVEQGCCAAHHPGIGPRDDVELDPRLLREPPNY